MKRLYKIFKLLLITVLIVVAVLAVVGVWLVRRAWPDVSGTLSVEGLKQPVRIIRDNFGIPSIYAQNDYDLLFAQGYVHAQDRLWQMEFNRIVMRGELSTIFGKAVLDSDRYMRTLGLLRASERDWGLANPETRSCIEAYSAGVNAFIDSHHGRFPIEFLILRVSPARWTPVDSILWGKMMALSMSQNHGVEIQRAKLVAKVGTEAAQQLLPPYPGDAAVIIPTESRSYEEFQKAVSERPATVTRLLGDLDQPWGSNSWVIAGSKTESGKPILGNDTHLGLQMPSIWYENGLHGGSYDCIGYSLPGAPLIIIGHNRRIAWGISNMCSDVQDLYIEKLNDKANPTQYQVKDQWQNLQVVEEKIRVKGNPDIDEKIMLTRHGPIINGIYDLADSPPMALRWTALEGGHLFEAVDALDRAGSWAEFRQALSKWDSPSMNFVYADVDGNIGYQATGKIPIRSANHKGLVPVPGDTDQYEWLGFIPFEDVPSVFNPTTGFIVAANNKVVPDSYPYRLAYDYGDPYRATRLTQLITAGGKVNMMAAEKIQAETYSLPAQSLRPYLLAITPENDLQKKAMEQVKSWDLRFTVDSVGACIYYTWYWCLVPNIISDELGEDLKDFRAAPTMLIPLMSQPNSPWFDDHKTAKVETRDDIVRKSFVDALDWLAQHRGPDMTQWTWGRLHTVMFAHQPLGRTGIGIVDRIFNSKRVPLPGEAYSVNSTNASKTRPFVVNFGVSQRLLVDLSDIENSESINSTGQSGLVFHCHREDQIPLWSAVKYHPLAFSKEKVEAQAESVLTLTPR